MLKSTDVNSIVHYRGYVLLEQQNRSWLVRPERSPITILPFRTKTCSLIEVKNELDLKISNNNQSL